MLQRTQDHGAAEAPEETQRRPGAETKATPDAFPHVPGPGPRPGPARRSRGEKVAGAGSLHFRPRAWATRCGARKSWVGLQRLAAGRRDPSRSSSAEPLLVGKRWEEGKKFPRNG